MGGPEIVPRYFILSNGLSLALIRDLWVQNTDERNLVARTFEVFEEAMRKAHSVSTRGEETSWTEREQERHAEKSEGTR